MEIVTEYRDISKGRWDLIGRNKNLFPWPEQAASLLRRWCTYVDNTVWRAS